MAGIAITPPAAPSMELVDQPVLPVLPIKKKYQKENTRTKDIGANAAKKLKKIKYLEDRLQNMHYKGVYVSSKMENAVKDKIEHIKNTMKRVD